MKKVLDSNKKIGPAKKSARGNLLLAIDPSLTSTGWAVFSISRSKLLAVGLLRAPGTDRPLSRRLSMLQEQVVQLMSALKLGKGDVLVCEGPAPLVRNPQSAIKVEHVRGIFECLARERGIEVPGRLNPRTVQVELLGLRGRQLQRASVKEAAQQVAGRLYQRFFMAWQAKEQSNGRKAKKLPQDIVDAVLIGTLALARVQLCRETKTALVWAFSTERKSSRKSSSGKRLDWSEREMQTFIRRQGND